MTVDWLLMHVKLAIYTTKTWKYIQQSRKSKQVKLYRLATDVKAYDHQITPRGSPNTSLRITSICSTHWSVWGNSRGHLIETVLLFTPAWLYSRIYTCRGLECVNPSPTFWRRGLIIRGGPVTHCIMDFWVLSKHIIVGLQRTKKKRREKSRYRNRRSKRPRNIEYYVYSQTRMDSHN